MATGDRRLDPRSSNPTILAVSATVAIAGGVATYQPILDAQGNDRDAPIAEPVDASPRCREADRESVAQLAAFLERNRPGDAPILERAIHTLSTARRHCLYDREGRGSEGHEWFRRWLNEHSREGNAMETLLGILAFTAFAVAQIAAVIAIHATRNTHQPDAFEAVRLDPRARAVWDSGG